MSPNIQIGQAYLVTTSEWFFAPDGIEYRAVFGTVHEVLSDKDTLGIQTNRNSTNWYIRIGCMVVAGCQIKYAVRTDHCWLGHAKGWSPGGGEFKEYKRPSSVFAADVPHEYSPAED